jgi:hypothetical protein
LQQQSRDGSSFTAFGRTGERARERNRVQHLAQHLEQQSQSGIATQQAQEAAAQLEVVALNNRMELRRSEEQFRRIAITSTACT